MVRNRFLRLVIAALLASIAASLAAGALGFVLVSGSMFVMMPHSEWTGFLVGSLLVAVFGVTFVACFREMLENLTPP